jgi:hypothetical protein
MMYGRFEVYKNYLFVPLEYILAPLKLARK